MTKSTIRKIECIIITIIFLTFISVPFIVGIIKEDKLTSHIEKRNLNKLPEFPANFHEITLTPAKINLYYADHFGFREKLTSGYFRLLSFLNNSASLDDVTIGKDDWLFLGSSKPGYGAYDDPMGDVMNINLYSEEELERFAFEMDKTKQWLAERGIAYLFVIAPNKHSIYFEFMPDYIQKQNEFSSTDQLVQYIKQNTDIEILDLRPSLFEGKKTNQLYSKTDTHWNSFGANIAQFEIMKAVQSLLPEADISPFILDRTQFNESIVSGGDLAALAAIETSEMEITPIFQNKCTPTEVTNSELSVRVSTFTCEHANYNTLIFRDSFFEALQPYISRYFEHSVYVWTKMETEYLVEYIEKEKPDIVINEVVERVLPYVPEYNFQ